MNIRLISKLVFLFVALSATIYSAILLNNGHMNDFWTSLGFSKNSQSLNWCTDRLLVLSGTKNNLNWTLKEQDRKWVIIKNETDTKQLDYLDIEKWLAKYCILDIVPSKDIAMLDMPVEHLATASFNDSSSVKIFKLGNMYQINHVTFTSPELQKGLEELMDLLKI
ncbi:MAG: hypothetical protein IT287_07850 [Bdellovibrionaceae bacterium]|nr:hypothetical protein [Pseudobdellovibrionaceae bacterium]